MSCYDELSLLHENAEELSLPWRGQPDVRRESVEVAPGQQVSGLIWGSTSPELVLLHGGAQNAHTWDSVALLLDRPLCTIDLPGHGHSDWRDDRDYSPTTNAEAVAVAVSSWAPQARLVVGMSLGGLTAIALAARHPQLVRRLMLVDVTPGADGHKAGFVTAFVTGVQRFDSFEHLLGYTAAANPARSQASLRRGLIHNAREEQDGTWVWRHHPGHLGAGERVRPEGGFAPLWSDLSRIDVPLMLVRAELSPVVDDDDVDRLRAERPGAQVEVVEGAGHSIQGDQPRRLAELIEGFLG